MPVAPDIAFGETGFAAHCTTKSGWQVAFWSVLIRAQEMERSE
jgi:hypothetical protein